jgi:hypothetical protein
MKIRTLLFCGPLAGVAALAVLAGCQTWGPAWSEISGDRYTVADFRRYPTVINLVDSYSPGPRVGYRGYSYYKIEPGRHNLELSAVNTTPNWVPGINREILAIDIEPCKRYYFNADFENRLLAGWKPVVDYVEPIPGCGVPG